MAELSKKEMIKIIEENIGKINDKSFTIYFYIFDTKGNPSGSLSYIYQTAYTLKELGYNVCMLHSDDDFIGVEDWLGKKYAELPHKQHQTSDGKIKENIQLSASDFVVIPDIFVNVMIALKNAPCKKIALVQNYNWLCESMPMVASFQNLKINDIITTTETQKQILESYFPGMNIFVVSPSINPVFRDSDKPRKLIVNIVSKDQSNIHRIMKPFHWKYPIYQWVSFNEVRGLPQEVVSDEFREAAITIWIDDETNFGYAPLEALRCGSIVLAKIPDTLTDWNFEIDEKTGEKRLTDACLWFSHVDEVPDMLASIVRTWTLDKIPSEIYTLGHKLDNLYSRETQVKEIEHVYINTIIDKRKKDFEEVLVQVKNKKTKEE